ncbi:MAG: metal ABC transporter permease [Alphaproteobacteria bacterium]
MVAIAELKWMLVPFLACLVLSINHVYLGIHVIARKVIFVDLALAQIAALGATYALVLGYDPNSDPLQVSLFSLAFTFIGAGAFAIARMRKERVPQEAFIGIIYAVASAAAILILSKSATGGEELKHMLVGDVLLVPLSDVLKMAVLYGVIGIFHVIFRKQFLAISLNPESAEASGFKIRIWDLLFYMSFGVVIVKSVAIVGVLLVFSYLVVPAVIAQMFSDTILGRLLAGWVVAIAASMLGIVWSFYSDYPTGPAVVVMLGSFLVLAGIIYYLRHAPGKGRALANVAALLSVSIVFFLGLSALRKSAPAVTAAPETASVDHLLQELETGEEVHQLDALTHLRAMHSPKIAPALAHVLMGNPSEQIVEAVVNALKERKDAAAIAALRHAAQGNYDAFLQLSIAEAQLASGDAEGFVTLAGILKGDGAPVARQRASELLEKSAGKKFGYNADGDLRQNGAAVASIETWIKNEGKTLR